MASLIAQAANCVFGSYIHHLEWLKRELEALEALCRDYQRRKEFWANIRRRNWR